MGEDEISFPSERPCSCRRGGPLFFLNKNNIKGSGVSIIGDKTVNKPRSPFAMAQVCSIFGAKPSMSLNSCAECFWDDS